MTPNLGGQMLIDQYRAMARYNRWMNDKIYALCATLGEEELTRDRGAFFKSIHGTLNHILFGDRVWMARFTGDVDRFPSRDASNVPLQYARFEDLWNERKRTDTDILAWTDSLDEAWLSATFRYATLDGTPSAHVAWWAVGHFFNHQTHHRGQVTTLLMQSGHDPKVTDLIAMLRTE
jgi:uncharacterized damage-inducible protein DinB